MAASKIISLALLIVILQQCSSAPQVCTFWKGVYFPAPWRRLAFDRQSFQSPKLLYGVCDPASHGKTCRLVRDRDEPLQGGNYTCKVDVKPSLRGGALGEEFRVVPFADEDRVILAWLERSNSETRLGLTSVRFSDCAWHEVRANVDHSFDDDLVLDDVHLLPYRSTYDVLYPNQRQCGDKFCKLSVDVDGNRVGQPAAWSVLDRNNHRIVDVKTIGDAADKGALAIEINANECQFSILQGNDKKILKVYGSTDHMTVASSASNELIATCHLSGSTLNCAQYDQSGNVIVDSTNRLQGDFRVLAIHNLRGGAGLLVLLNDKAQNRVHALRLDMKGKQVGKMDVNNFQCDQNLNEVAGNFWEKDEQYCASLACYETDAASARKNDRGHLTATAKCFFLNNLEPVS